MKWTDKAPSVPGWYWFRDIGYVPPGVVWVFGRDGRMCFYPDDGSEAFECYCDITRGQWSENLPPPEDD